MVIARPTYGMIGTELGTHGDPLPNKAPADKAASLLVCLGTEAPKSSNRALPHHTRTAPFLKSRGLHPWFLWNALNIFESLGEDLWRLIDDGYWRGFMGVHVEKIITCFCHVSNPSLSPSLSPSLTIVIPQGAQPCSADKLFRSFRWLIPLISRFYQL